MRLKFPRVRLPAMCCDWLSTAVCAVLGLLLGSTAIAAPGQLDPTFGANGIVIDALASSSTGLAAGLQEDGKLIVVGACATGSAVNFCAARYLPSGLPDVHFGTNGHVITAAGDSFAQAYAVAVQTDGHIVVAGFCSNGGFGFCLTRYDPTGRLDASFGSGGIVLPTPDGTSSRVTSVRVQVDGGIVAAGRCASPRQSTPNLAELCVVRYLPNGALDTQFGQSGKAILNRGQFSEANAIAIQGDGKIVAAGRCNDVGLNNFCVARFDTSGAPDTSFGTGGATVTPMTSQAFEAAIAVALTRTGRIVAGGYCLVNDQLAFCLARYLEGGQLDASFGSMGKVFTPIGVTGGARALAIQSDGKVLAVGDCSPVAQTFDYCAARYAANGALDVSFGGGTIIVPIGAGEDRGRAVVIQPDGKIVVAGYCMTSGANRFCLARFLGGPYPSADCGLDVDRNLVTDPETDALLTLRFLFGYRGSSLLLNLVGQNAVRSGAEIESHLAAQLNSNRFDADGDGQSLAIADGVLMLRAMLGITGTALTQGATNASHPNVRNAQQILTWIENTHGVACLP